MFVLFPDPERNTQFGVIVAQRLAERYGLKSGIVKKYNRLYRDFLAVDEMNVMHLSSNVTGAWIKQDQTQVVIMKLCLVISHFTWSQQ